MLWNQLEESFVMTMPSATKMMVPLHVDAEIPFLAMAGPLDQAVMKVINEIPVKLTMALI